jgi:predicted nucleotidyltransferase component of viral defense system
MTINDASSVRKQVDKLLNNGKPHDYTKMKIAKNRFLARVCSANENSPFFVKGGTGMEIRLTIARSTKDLDITHYKRTPDENEPISEITLRELQNLASKDLKDHFTFLISPSQRPIENSPYGGTRHSVKCYIGNKPYTEFHLDVAEDFLIHPYQIVPCENPLKDLGIPTPEIQLISSEQQLAEKLHAYTDIRHPRTRSKDLFDMVCLVDNIDPQTGMNIVDRVFKARNTHELPEKLPEPPKDWEQLFANMATECAISVNMHEGFAKVTKFHESMQATKLATIPV